MRYLKIILSGSVSLFLSGCATMFGDPTQEVEVSSSDGKPVAVKVYRHTFNTFNATLPVKIVTKPNTFQRLYIEVSDPCYEPSRSYVNRYVTPMYWANFLNLYGLGIDLATGYVWEYPDNFSVTTTPVNDPPPECLQRFADIPENKARDTLYLSKRSLMKNHKNRSRQSMEKHIAGIGLTRGKVTNSEFEASGVYISYQYEFAPQWRTQLRFSSMAYECNIPESFNCGNNDIYVKKRTISAGLNYFPIQNSKFYLGMGTGLSSIEQSYNYSNKPDSSALLAPIYLDIGYQAGGRFRFHIFATISPSTFGFGSPITIREKDRTGEITDLALQKDVRTLLDDAKQYSEIGIGIEWQP